MYVFGRQGRTEKLKRGGKVRGGEYREKLNLFEKSFTKCPERGGAKDRRPLPCSVLLCLA